MEYPWKRLKQWWSTIQPIATKQAIASHHNSLSSKKKIMIYDVGNSGLCLRQAHTYGGIKPVNGISYTERLNSDDPQFHQ